MQNKKLPPGVSEADVSDDEELENEIGLKMSLLRHRGNGCKLNYDHSLPTPMLPGDEAEEALQSQSVEIRKQVRKAQEHHAAMKMKHLQRQTSDVPQHKTAKLSKELSDLVNYVQAVHFKGIIVSCNSEDHHHHRRHHHNQFRCVVGLDQDVSALKPYEMSSFSETKCRGACRRVIFIVLR